MKIEKPGIGMAGKISGFFPICRQFSLGRVAYVRRYYIDDIYLYLIPCIFHHFLFFSTQVWKCATINSNFFVVFLNSSNILLNSIWWYKTECGIPISVSVFVFTIISEFRPIKVFEKNKWNTMCMLYVCEWVICAYLFIHWWNFHFKFDFMIADIYDMKHDISYSLYTHSNKKKYGK